LRHVLSLNRIRYPHLAATGPAWAFAVPKETVLGNSKTRADVPRA
jgi:hypothetical protein